MPSLSPVSRDFTSPADRENTARPDHVAAFTFLHCTASLSLEVIVVFCNLLSFLLSLRSSMFFASSRMPAQCIQERQNLYQLHLPEEITADSLWASLVPRHPGSLFTVLPGTLHLSPASCSRPCPCPPCWAQAPEEGCGGGFEIRLNVFIYYIKFIAGPSENSSLDTAHIRVLKASPVPLNFSWFL